MADEFIAFTVALSSEKSLPAVGLAKASLLLAERKIMSDAA